MNEFCETRSAVSVLPPDADWRAEVRHCDFVLLIAVDSVKLIRADEDFSADRLTELRAFSMERELHLIRRGGAFFGRLRVDGGEDGGKTEYLEQNQALWGSVKRVSGGCAELHDDRGIDLSIPLPADQTAAVGERCFLAVRSYLDPDDFRFTDYRICGISFKKAVNDDD